MNSCCCPDKINTSCKLSDHEKLVEQIGQIKLSSCKICNVCNRLICPKELCSSGICTSCDKNVAQKQNRLQKLYYHCIPSAPCDYVKNCSNLEACRHFLNAQVITYFCVLVITILMKCFVFSSRVMAMITMIQKNHIIPSFHG